MDKEGNVNDTNLYTELYEAAVRSTPVPPEMLVIDNEYVIHRMYHILNAIKACAVKEERSE